MLSELKAYIKKENFFQPKDKILLALSGGVDSVVLANLFHKADINFGIAHCNFKLRGKESDEDELFAENISEKYQVPFHSVIFDTKIYAKKNKISIQEAARDLRYAWFEEIRKQHKYSFIATAHHGDDSIETFLINLMRGTGIAGMHGILPKQNRIIRPLLFTNKEEILKYSKKHILKYREDSSNASDKYLRNKIRQQVIPLLKEFNPQIEKVLANNIQNLQEVETIYKAEVDKKRKQLLHQEAELIKIPVKKLKELNPLSSYLYEFLRVYGFNTHVIPDIIQALDKNSGKQFFSPSHRLIKDRDFLLLKEITSQNNTLNNTFIQVKKKDRILSFGKQKLSIQPLPAGTNFSRSRNTAALDMSTLKFPLKIRKWKEGDVFRPFGMKGKKKLSDFFIDNKFSLAQKENTWLLLSGTDIAWVIGHRIDDRFKVTGKTTEIYFAELSE